MEELEMYETLEYIKDRFEGENEGLKFSYLGVDEKRKDTLYERMELEKDGKKLLVSTSIGNCWRLLSAVVLDFLTLNTITATVEFQRVVVGLLM